MHTIRNLLKKLNSIVAFWVFTALMTQSFAAGLSCVHHSQNSNHPTFITYSDSSHSTPMANPPSHESHDHHASLMINPALTQMSGDNLAHQMPEHCQMQATNSEHNPDCKCTFFISVELLSTPTLHHSAHTVSYKVTAYSQRLFTTDTHSIFRPPLNA